MHFLCATKYSPLEAIAKIDFKVPEKPCDETWWQCDQIHITGNLGQKYEGDLGY